MNAAPRSTREQLEQELTRAVDGEVRFDRYSRQLYATDASIYKITPLGVVIPQNADDVSATIETCVKAGISVLPRGGGTGLSGQTVNRGVVIDSRSSCMMSSRSTARKDGFTPNPESRSTN